MCNARIKITRVKFKNDNLLHRYLYWQCSIYFKKSNGRIRFELISKRYFNNAPFWKKKKSLYLSTTLWSFFDGQMFRVVFYKSCIRFRDAYQCVQFVCRMRPFRINHVSTLRTDFIRFETKKKKKNPKWKKKSNNKKYLPPTPISQFALKKKPSDYGFQFGKLKRQWHSNARCGFSLFRFFPGPNRG